MSNTLEMDMSVTKRNGSLEAISFDSSKKFFLINSNQLSNDPLPQPLA